MKTAEELENLNIVGLLKVSGGKIEPEIVQI